jgi:hypothetical protein
MKRQKKGYRKLFVRPTYGLSLKILRSFMSKKEVEALLDRYMIAKKDMILAEFQRA